MKEELANEEHLKILNEICEKQNGRSYEGVLDITEDILLKFTRRMCELQIKYCSEHVSEYSVNNDSIIRDCENIMGDEE